MEQTLAITGLTFLFWNSSKTKNGKEHKTLKTYVNTHTHTRFHELHLNAFLYNKEEDSKHSCIKLSRKFR